MIIHEMRQGPLRAIITANGGALALFDRKIRNRIVKNALKEAGNHWLWRFMPLRFTNYAYKLGYRVSARWRRIKEENMGRVIPYMGLTPSGGGDMGLGGKWWQRNREKMARAVERSRLTATGLEGRELIRIFIPYGHPIRTEASNRFKTIIPSEVEAMAVIFARRIANGITQASVIQSQVSERAVRRIATVEVRRIRNDRRTQRILAPVSRAIAASVSTES